MSQITVAALQLRAHERASLAQAWPAALRRIREAASAGAQLIVLPEGTLPAYVLGHRPYDGAEIAQALDDCAALAAQLRVVIVVGAARHADAKTYNSAIVIDRDGSIAGSADKHFLWHFDRQWFAPGQALQPVRTSLGSIGALVCADGRIPTIARALVDGGAQLLVMPTAWVTSGRDPHQLENVQADLLARVRARENGVAFVAANKCGVELNCVAYCGKSQIVRADGSMAAMASQDCEETLIASIETGQPRVRRAPPTAARAARIIANGAAPCRVAITASNAFETATMHDRLRILEADILIAPGNPHACSDDEVLDPGVLAHRRLAGETMAVWQTAYDPQWQVAFARTRALELRIYVVVIDPSRGRAFAVDPDGAVVCGTFGDYRIASFSYEPARTAQTFVAPGTDVLEGLRRARVHDSQ